MVESLQQNSDSIVIKFKEEVGSIAIEAIEKVIMKCIDLGEVMIIVEGVDLRTVGSELIVGGDIQVWISGTHLYDRRCFPMRGRNAIALLANILVKQQRYFIFELGIEVESINII